MLLLLAVEPFFLLFINHNSILLFCIFYRWQAFVKLAPYTVISFILTENMTKAVTGRDAF